MMNDILLDTLGARELAFLSGPSFARCDDYGMNPSCNSGVLDLLNTSIHTTPSSIDGKMMQGDHAGAGDVRRRGERLRGLGQRGAYIGACDCAWPDRSAAWVSPYVSDTHPSTQIVVRCATSCPPITSASSPRATSSASRSVGWRVAIQPTNFTKVHAADDDSTSSHVTGQPRPQPQPRRWAGRSRT